LISQLCGVQPLPIDIDCHMIDPPVAVTQANLRCQHERLRIGG
jgi:hypothetical protein